jgi:hypothetical protein
MRQSPSAENRKHRGRLLSLIVGAGLPGLIAALGGARRDGAKPSETRRLRCATADNACIALDKLVGVSANSRRCDSGTLILFASNIECGSDL